MKYTTLLFLGLFAVACAPTRFIEPVEEGKLAAGAAFGGPLIDFAGAPIPVPLTSLEVGYGFKENLTFFGGIHTTAAVFGNLQVDLGGTYKFLDQDRFKPNISVSPSLNTIWDIYDKKIKAWPVIDFNAYWNYGDKMNYVYVGANSFVELSAVRALEQDQPTPLLFNPQIGHVLKGKERKWEFITEIKFLSPFSKSAYSFVPYRSITGDYGATAIFLGYRYYFNLNKK
jgi:hypothetical protein